MKTINSKECLGYNESALNLIKNIPLLADLKKEDLKVILEHANYLTFNADETILEENADDISMFFLLQGTVQIVKNDAVICEMNHSGDLFGEMAFVEALPRSASVKAKTLCRVIEVDTVIFDEFDARHMWHVSNHFFKIFLKKLSEKLRSSSKENANLRNRLTEIENLIMSSNPL